MTGTGTGKEPWDDDRLAAAFREAFDVTAPRDLEDRLAEAAASRARPRGAGLGWLRSSGAGAGAVAAVAVVVIAVGVLVSNGLPAASPAASVSAAGSPTSTLAGTPTAAFPAAIFGVEVLTVPEAIEVRDRGDATEIAVAGWFRHPGAMRCLAMPGDPVRPLEGDCTIAFTWLMANPESLIHRTGTSGSDSPPTGPAFNPVFEDVDRSWVYPLPTKGASTPNAVVFVGHFNDPRADRCLIDSPEVCARRFVVDQVAWVDGAAYDAVFPADIDGIPVWTVEETLRRRDAGEAHGIGVAIGGWYAESVSITISCPPPIEAWSPLERYCHAGQELLTDIPQSIDAKSPPSGAALAPFFSPFWGSEFLAERQTPQPVILVGHFDDPLHVTCSHLGRYACISLFVVDRIAWHDGEARGARAGSSNGTNVPVPTRDIAAVEQVVRRSIAAAASIQSVTLLEERDVAGLDPTTDVDPNGLDLVWYIRAVESGSNQVGSFIVADATGELVWSAFPMPQASELP
ncbi:MAG: hypothetical protein AB1736_06390 [Chloroflexota bacterium]